jgi:glutamate/tyrosine decarboxylase-like PLP-dependent enzyme
VWVLLRHLGVEGYRELVARDVAVADHLADGVRAAPDLELVAAGLSVVCFRYRPPGLDDPGRLDDLNRAVLAAVQLGGRSFVGGTTVAGAAALRACVVNPRAGADDVDAILADVRAAGARIAGDTS